MHAISTVLLQHPIPCFVLPTAVVCLAAAASGGRLFSSHLELECLRGSGVTHTDTLAA